MQLIPSRNRKSETSGTSSFRIDHVTNSLSRHLQSEKDVYKYGVNLDKRLLKVEELIRNGKLTDCVQNFLQDHLKKQPNTIDKLFDHIYQRCSNGECSDLDIISSLKRESILTPILNLSSFRCEKLPYKENLSRLMNKTLLSHFCPLSLSEVQCQQLSAGQNGKIVQSASKQFAHFGAKNCSRDNNVPRPDNLPIEAVAQKSFGQTQTRFFTQYPEYVYQNHFNLLNQSKRLNDSQFSNQLIFGIDLVVLAKSNILSFDRLRGFIERYGELQYPMFGDYVYATMGFHHLMMLDPNFCLWISEAASKTLLEANLGQAENRFRKYLESFAMGGCCSQTCVKYLQLKSNPGTTDNFSGTEYGIRLASLGLGTQTVDPTNLLLELLSNQELSSKTAKSITEKLSWVNNKATFMEILNHFSNSSKRYATSNEQLISWFALEASNFPQSALWILKKFSGFEGFVIELNSPKTDLYRLSKEFRLSDSDAEEFTNNIYRVLKPEDQNNVFIANWLASYGKKFLHFVETKNSS